MGYQTVCGTCNHVRAAYFHTINKPLVQALKKLVDFYCQTGRGANLQKDLHLNSDVNVNNNFQKLQYFDLVMRIEGQGWLPTQTGIDFICGEAKVYNRVATLESEVLPIHHPAWEEGKKRPQLVSVWEIDDMSYKKRDEYRQEKSRQIQAL